MKHALIFTGIVGLIALGIGYEVMLWSECLDTNSVWFCMRVLSQ